jgi:hypothetical protein
MKAERYLQPEFVQELRKKAIEYFIGADQFKSSANSRFPKNVAQDPLFKAIAYLRMRGWAEQKLKQDFASDEDLDFQRFLAANMLDPKGLVDILEKLLGARDFSHAKLLADTCLAVRTGDIGGLNKIVKFCEIFEKKTYGRGRRSPKLPWEYYAAVAAFVFLNKGIIPLKKEVKEAALRERAIMEHPVWYKEGTEEQLAKLKEAGAPNEMRIDPEPAHGQDPDGYYGASDEAPDSGPADKGKGVLPEKEQEPLTPLERQQQREGISHSQLPKRKIQSKAASADA